MSEINEGMKTAAEGTAGNLGKLYTVEDIAAMTMMTSRTIRNYLKEGILKGKKIGGQWRFTEDDFMNLVKGTYKGETFNGVMEDIPDFIDGVNDFIMGKAQACTIVDLYQDMDVVAKKQGKLLEYINSHEGTLDNWMSFSSKYIENEGKARVMIFGSPKFLIEALRILE